MREAGARGEVAVARIRLAAVLLLGLIPVSASLRSGEAQDLAGLAIFVLAALLAAVVIRAALSRRWPRLGLVTGLLDVTLISVALGLYLVLGRPWMAVNSKVTFLIYFLAIAASALRYDQRLCVLVGGVAIAEYLAIVLAANAGWDVHGAAFNAGGYGRFEWSAQINRVFLLVIATLFAVAVVRRTHRLLVATGLYEQRLAELSRRLMAAQEEERGRLSRELHDELGQSMTALKLRLISLSRTVGSEELRAQVGTSLEIVQDAMARVRDLAQALRPPLLDDLGLETAIRWQAERLAKDAGFTVEVEARGLPPSPSSERTTACFRVAQEALTNIARHDAARHVHIDIMSADAELRH
jgi:signal transduction histidine kinase